MKYTIRDIAQIAGVSAATVSRIMNNEGKFKEPTIKKVRSVLRKMNYDPVKNIPHITKNTRRGIGLVFPRIGNPVTPTWDRFIAAFKKNCDENTLRCSIYEEDEVRAKVANGMGKVDVSHMADGFVFICPNREGWIRSVTQLRTFGIPVVVINRKLDLPGVSTVSANENDGIIQMLRHLSGLGHKRIAYFRHPGHKYVTDHRVAYRHYLKNEMDGNVPELLVEHYDSIAPSDRPAWLGEYIQRNKPTAIFCNNDVTACEVIKILKGIDLDVPRHMAVTSFGNNYIADLFSPGITSVNMPVQQLSRLAVRVLKDALLRPDTPTQHMTVNCDLVIRESCGSTQIHQADRNEVTAIT